MWSRPSWVTRIESAWARRNVLWLMGVRRVGKTVLAKGLADATYFDCELPSTRRQTEDPERFLAGLDQGRIVLDEIHRLDDPAQLLKIAADHFPKLSVLATGSSTLGASSRFRDTLAGRKEELWLCPMTAADVVSAKGSLRQRLLHGGLPPFFEAEDFDDRAYQEWLDAYWARDVLELFRLERRRSFQKLFELLLVQSGGMFEANSLSGPCEVSRTTIANYLAVLESTFVMHVVKPFSGNTAREIVAAPKVYGFDTGFVRAFRGWREPRPEDEGALFEHFVLNELHALIQRRVVQYWRTKRGEEIDFVIPERGTSPVAIECKRSSDEFDPRPLQLFRQLHPGGRNFLVTMDTVRSFEKRYGDLAVEVVGPKGLVAALSHLDPFARKPRTVRKKAR
ncbi:MAG: ATP-binding protein [Planctomycetota bacterium]